MTSHFVSAATSRKRRSLSTFYTEVLQTRHVPESHTLVYLTALQVDQDYFPLLAEDACAALKSTSRHCVDAQENDVIEEAGLHSPPIYGQGGTGESKGTEAKPQSGGLSSGATAGIAVVVLIILFLVLVGAIFFYRRKYKEAKVRKE